MATKTVVCPECGSSAVPGRYACAECGALLAAVAASPRAYGDELDPTDSGASAPTSDAAPADTVQREPATAHEQPPAPETAAPDAAQVAPTAAPRTPRYLPSNGRPPRPGARAEPPWVGTSAWDDEIADDSPSAADAVTHDDDAPIASVTAAFEATAPTVTPEPPPAAAVSSSPAADVRPPAVADPPPTGQTMTPASAPTWPPVGDRGPQPLPAGRTPAGAWLPPSAVLDALDPAAASAPATRGRPGTTEAEAKIGRSVRGFDVRALLGSLDLGDDTPRAGIAVGAAIAAIGFLLPWANILAGAGLLGGYFTQWGLAGPGHWIVVALLLGMVVVALAGAPTARWPVGPAAIALAALLLGMTWPYLFGVLGKSVGIWVVLAGAIVLVVGSVLDGRDRHDPEGPPVG